MSNLTRAMMMGAGGVASGDTVYVDDVFSTYLYEGTSETKTIKNGIELGSNIGVSLNGKTITDTTGSADYSKLNNDIFSSANTDYYYGSIDCYIDYGSAVVSTFYDLAPQGDNVIGAVYNTPTSITGYGSNDASSWTSLGAVSFTTSDWAEGKFTRYHFPSNTTAYRYYRLTSSGTTSIQEWRLGISDSSLGKGGIVWVKKRDDGTDNVLITHEAGSILSTNTENLKTTNNTGFISSFNSDGFTLGNGVSGSNSDNANIVSWTFRKQRGFFDVVTYNGGTSSQSIPHNLGSEPGMIIVKCTSHDSNWRVYHRSLGATQYEGLNQDFEAFAATSVWNDTAPTSTQFTVGTSTTVNGSGRTFVAYLFAHDRQSFGTGGNESIIKCGTYTGNGSTAGPVINLGFEPQWLMIKNVTSRGTDSNWLILDNMRGVTNASTNDTTFGYDKALSANLTNPEDSSPNYANYNFLDFTSTGFKLTTQGTALTDTNGDNYIYMAIRRPHKPPTTGRDVYQAITYSGTSGNIKRATNFAVDMVHSNRTNSGTPYALDRVRGGYQYLETGGSSQEGEQPTGIHTFGNDYLYMGGGPIINGNNTYILEMFRRAPGFFDIVHYYGNATPDHAVPHNLGVVPELVFVKTRDFGNTAFPAYTSTGGVTKHMYWGDTGNESTTTAGQMWGPSAFTSTNIYLGSYSNVNYDLKPHIGYLFASLDKISKIGRYTGTGNAITVDCEFDAPARFVMIKRTDIEIANTTNPPLGTNWYYWDSVRGINTGNDPYMIINLGNQQVTNTDYIDPLDNGGNSGFSVTASAPAALNADGGTYLYLAIA